jgi:hypothetical protein
MISTSVLKGKAIYGDLLLKQGYKRYQVDDLAVSEFLSYEHERIGEPTDLYLLAIKKILLYAIPVIAPPSIASKRGVSLTAQFATDCIINNATKDMHRLTIGDKYILLGFAFPLKLTNNLDFSTFEWKYYHQYPKEYILHSLDISHLDGIDSTHLTKKKSLGAPSIIHMIKPSHYEDLSLYNQILHMLKLHLNEYTDTWTSILNQIDENTHMDAIEFKPLERIKPLNDIDTIAKLNLILEKQIDPTYTISYYETLQTTANWLLYNHIWLYGYDSPVVTNYLSRLAYTKSENHKVFIGLAQESQQKLLQTRAEKICREQYPYYFSPGDRRGIFSRFNRFNITKIAKAHQNEINILLEKELAHQAALINNKCPHMPIVKALLATNSDASDIVRAYNDVLPFIDMDRKSPDSHTYYCKNCSYELLCEHEVEFYSEIKLSKEDQLGLDKSDNDMLYAAQQIIVNHYKQTQIAIDRSDIFSYHCKYCAKELGKSDDIIQVPRSDQWGPQVSMAQDLHKNMAYAALFTILTNHVDPIVLGLDKKRVIRSVGPTVRNHLEDVSYAFRKLADENTIELHTKLSALVLGLCAMISLNINVLKTNKQLLIDFKSKLDDHKGRDKLSKQPSLKEALDDDEGQRPSGSSDSEPSTDESSGDEERPAVIGSGQPTIGGSIKTEFASAFSIIKHSNQIKHIAISDDKIRSMLLDYYRRISKDIGDVIDVNTIYRTNEDRLSNEISQSPVYAYVRHMVARNNKTTVSRLPFKQVMGLEITKGITGNLYEKIPADKVKPADDHAKYIHESYDNIRRFLADGKYLGSEIEPELSQFMREYERKQRIHIRQLMHNPKYFTDERNAREVSFDLKNLNLIYCDGTDHITKHRWVDGVCSICKISMGKVSQSHNQSIVSLIDSEIAKDALFDLYANNCPIKDIHIYADESVGLDSKCTQCGVTKKRLLDQDPKYYKQYLSQFNTHHKGQIEALVSKVNALTATQVVNKSIQSIDPDATIPNESELDAKNDQMVLSLSKIFEIAATDIQELNPIFLDSYIRLVYERYAYASNLSYDMSKHPDVEFYDLIKSTFFNGTKPLTIAMDKLPMYKYQDASTKVKRYQLLSLLMIIIKNDSNVVVELGRFLIKKIIAQEARRREFNFAKLKSVTIITEDSEMEVIEEMDDQDDENDEESMFMAYDIDMDDMEDNMDGDLD